VKREVTIETAPRLLWAEVVATEDDSYPNPWSSFFSGMRLTFAEPGAWIREAEQYVLSHVADHFDVSELLEGVSETPFVMSTPDWAIAYKVEGRLKVEASRGTWLNRSDPAGRALGNFQPFQLSAELKTLSLAPGQGGMISGKDGRVHSVIQGPDGAVYHAADGQAAGASGKGVSIGGSVAGPVTAVAGERGLSLFGLSPDGAVLQATEGEREWRALGGRFAGTVTAVAGERGGIELFAADGDGAIFRFSVGDRSEEERSGEEWERVGQDTSGVISALSSPRSGLSLFALGRGGELLHKRRPPDGSWQPAEDWEKLGVASEGALSAEWMGDESVLLAVVAEDETVRVLAWEGYPDAPAPGEWLTIGTVNSLLQGAIPGRRND
jgi:hypothetical protein